MNRLLKYLLLTFLMTASGVIAQPQAPVTWGEVRVLQNAPQYYRPVAVYAHGDTLVLNAAWEGASSDPAACISSDNGQTWGPWRILGQEGQGFRLPGVEVVFLEDEILGCADTSPFTRGFYSTTNLGNSWITPPCSLNTLQYYSSRNDTLFCGVGANGVTWTADHGHSFSPIRTVDLGSIGHIGDISTSSQYIHVVSCYPREQFTRFRLFYFRAPIYEGVFGPGVVLNDDIFRTETTHITVDDEGVGVILSSVYYDSPWGYPAIVRNSTRDDGLTWSAADTLTPFESQEGGAGEGIERNGHLWVAYWVDSTRDAGFDYGRVRCQLSANSGRSWYPNQQAEGAPWSIGEVTSVEVQPNCVRAFIACQRLNDVAGQYFLEVVGQIQRDALTPEIFDAVHLTGELAGDSVISFEATASDDDSLWSMSLVIRHGGQMDSVVLPLERIEGNEYATQWQVPPDTAVWQYYYRSEDMWENVAYMPEAGPQDPWSFHVGPLALNNIGQSDFSVSTWQAYPNPANGAVIITGMQNVLAGTQDVLVYDVLGRFVTRLPIPFSGERQFQLRWDLSNINGVPISNGLYFIRGTVHGSSCPTLKLSVLR